MLAKIIARVFIGIVLSGSVYANSELGVLTLDSIRNEPFNGTIVVTHESEKKVKPIKIRLGSIVDFYRYQLEPSELSSNLSFSIVDQNEKQTVIRVTSDLPITTRNFGFVVKFYEDEEKSLGVYQFTQPLSEPMKDTAMTVCNKLSWDGKRECTRRIDTTINEKGNNDVNSQSEKEKPLAFNKVNDSVFTSSVNKSLPIKENIPLKEENSPLMSEVEKSNKDSSDIELAEDEQATPLYQSSQDFVKAEPYEIDNGELSHELDSLSIESEDISLEQLSKIQENLEDSSQFLTEKNDTLMIKNDKDIISSKEKLHVEKSKEIASGEDYAAFSETNEVSPIEKKDFEIEEISELSEESFIEPQDQPVNEDINIRTNDRKSIRTLLKPTLQRKSTLSSEEVIRNKHGVAKVSELFVVEPPSNSQ